MLYTISPKCLLGLYMYRCVQTAEKRSHEQYTPGDDYDHVIEYFKAILFTQGLLASWVFPQ